MRLLSVYFVLVFVGLIISYAAGFVGDRWSQTVGLIAFLGCFFATLWYGWVLAVQLTEERPAHSSRSARRAD